MDTLQVEMIREMTDGLPPLFPQPPAHCFLIATNEKHCHLVDFRHMFLIPESLFLSDMTFF